MFLLRIAFLAFLFSGLSGAHAAQRLPWTTSHLHGTPEPPLPYRLESVYPKGLFIEPICATTIPGTNRIVVVQRHEKLVSVPYGPKVKKADSFGDLRKFNPEASECYGIAFHPQFAKHRYAYVFLLLDATKDKSRKDGVSVVRFRVTEQNPPRLDMKSGVTLVSWQAGGHSGGDVRFGPDGMLYISTGDAGSPDPPDPFATGQDISDLLSSVLRIDVDHEEDGKHYAIPADNPFVSTPGARGEVWAYGFRNPWRMTFDARSGDLWVADVGWELWEIIDRVQRGGNYGWSITEGGKQDVRSDRPVGPTPILPPTVLHSHEESASITGGEVYYGTRLPELSGAYIYGDWVTGTFWSMRFDGEKVTEQRVLCQSDIMPAGFGIAPDGDLLICDQGAGTGISRLVRNPAAHSAVTFPRRLSETGLFADVATHKLAPGVMPFEVNALRWADHAASQRWIGLPGHTSVTIAETEKEGSPGGRWVFPEDAVCAKTYSIEMEAGNPKSRRRLETQILHFNGFLWGAYSYRWNEAQTDADLVDARGAEETLQIKDASAPGGVREQVWRYYNRSECLRCHNKWDNFSPGFSELQLKRSVGDPPEPQLALLRKLGIAPMPYQKPKTPPVPGEPVLPPLPDPVLVDPYAASEDLELRVRSYLHVNCSTCHRPAGGGSVPSYMNIETPLAEARLISAKPVQGDLGLSGARVIAPGAPSSSVLLYRMATIGRGHMPYLGARTRDAKGVLLVRDWIASLPLEADLPAEITQQREKEAAALAQVIAGESAPVATLLSSPSGVLSLALAVMDGSITGAMREQVITQGAALPEALQRGLFEPYISPENRRKTVSPDVKPETLLAMSGDATRGKAQFTTICGVCHRAGPIGVDFAPDLSHIATKYDRAKIVDRILDPATYVEPQWELATLLTNDGERHTGFVASWTEKEVLLRLPGGAALRIPVEDVASLKTSRTPVMPEGLLQSCTESEAADLLAFLWSLK